MSKVVFVGNVPYNYGEEQLIDVFKSVGSVVGFRLVFDRDTGKPKGYGFCEFADHETALSAVRNLNNQDVGGRPLRIDLADSDPFLEGKTTVRGELIDSGWGTRGGGKGGDVPPFLKSLPPGQPLQPGMNALDVITQTLANTNPTQVVEVLAQMKAFVITHPEQARALLVHNPQLAYALFQALVLNKIVDPAVLQRMLGNTSATAPSPAATSAQAPASFVPPPAPAASQAAFYPQPQPQQPAPQPSFFGAPPAQVRAPPPVIPTPTPSATPLDHLNIDPAQKAMLMQVLSLTPEQINALAPGDRDTLLQLRRSFNL
ncbi:hypothetical protein PENSPDRAFT_646937 [Peniophora sp. CONT]|nr:hypothetical protein PENSPDRAFT_646937 [Peniophora sp. CONT]